MSERVHTLLGFAVTLAMLAIFAAGGAAVARAPIVPRGQSFTCTPVSVWDGDGPIKCAEGTKVRLARINARERDGTCRKGAPCPAAPEIAARRELVRLLGGGKGMTRDGHTIVAGPPMRCRSDGWAKGDRTAAWCALADGTDLSSRLTTLKVVSSWPRR